MVHRDIKPHNLMLTPEGRIKVLDFGLARYASDALRVFSPAARPPTDSGGAGAPAGSEIELASPGAATREHELTCAYAGLGTADYMAPEEGLDARRADIRADIYSLGCTLYRFLTGRVPFPGGTPIDKLQRHLHARPRPVEELRPDLPPALGPVVARMMARDAGQRYQTPADVALALAPFTRTNARPILIVEDDRATRQVMMTVLRERGYPVACAGNGREALELLRTGPRPALILLDLLMPVMDGWQFLREQRRDPALADVPVIVVSADRSAARDIAASAVAYLHKPIEFEELMTRVRRHAG
jgi:CheY-like chemotaxis protein